MALTVEVFDRNRTRVECGRLTLAVQSVEASAIGGPTVAQIEASGDTLMLWAAQQWLAYTVNICNGEGTVIWWGYIESVAVRTPHATATASLTDLRNRINVDYTYSDNDGAQKDSETGWLQNDASVARYGRREERVSLADTDSDGAQKKRTTVLNTSLRAMLPRREWSGGEPGATLDCRGPWSLLDVIYYPNALGRIVYDEGATLEHILGWKLADTDRIAFNRKVGLKIHDLNARLGALVEGTRLDVSGTASNNASYTVTGAVNADLEYHTYTTNDVFFADTDEVYDNLDGFSVFDAGEMIYITGTDDDAGHAENDGLYILQTVEPHNIEVWDSTIENSATGQTVTFAQGHSVTVEEPPVNEWPGAATFVLQSRGVRVAQSFQITGSTAWAAHEIMVRVRKIGAPGVALYVRIYSDSAGTPNAVLAEGSLAASEIRTVSEWVTVALGTACTLQPATTYWVAVHGQTTVGSMDQNCYALGLCDDADNQYGGGVCKVQIVAGSWETRWGDAVSMPFQVWGKQETTAQVQAMAAYALPEHSVLVRAGSGVMQRQYRDGKQRAGNEAQDLIETGDTDGQRLAVAMTPERLILIGVEAHAESADATQCLRYDAQTGALRRADGGPVPEGYLPAGQVVISENLEGVGPLLTTDNRMLVDRAVYNVTDRRLDLYPPGQRAAWEI